MKHRLRVSLWFIALFVGSDGVRAALQQRLHLAYPTRDSGWHQWLPSIEMATPIIYFMVFGIAGAAMARVVSRSLPGICFSIALGAAVPLSSLFFELPHPWIVHDHANTPWFVALSWVHWYMPPVACAVGALAWQSFSKRQARGENVA